jgi:hypothetical protein
MAQIFTDKSRAASLVELSSAPYRGGRSLPSAQATDADGRADTGADRIRRARAIAEQLTSPEQARGSNAFEPSGEARRCFE